jgi:NAD+ kinase
MVLLPKNPKGKTGIMKVFLYGKNSSDLKPQLEQYGLEETSSHPDLIISYGGDGTLLASERDYPGIPKLPVRDSHVCVKCPDHTTEHLLELLAQGEIKPDHHKKLQANFNGKDLFGLNDIVVRNLMPIHAIRFELEINNNSVGPALIIGDGIIVSTAFGSTGYYHSVTKKTFSEGYSIAFSNTIEKIESIDFEEGDEISLNLVRGPAVLSADNNPDIPTLKTDDTVRIFVSKRHALIYQRENLRCTDCKVHKEKRLR